MLNFTTKDPLGAQKLKTTNESSWNMIFSCNIAQEPSQLRPSTSANFMKPINFCFVDKQKTNT